MTMDPRNPWRFPSLEELGSGFDRLERSEHRSAEPRRRARSRLVALPAVGAVLAGAIALVLAVGGPAGAVSKINRAPAAAIRSRSVRFHSVIYIFEGAQQVAHLTQDGEIDFAQSAYRAVTQRGGEQHEWRSVGGVFYVTQARASSSRHGGWVAVRLTRGQRAKLALAPETDAVTDPLAVLRILADTHAPVGLVERGVVDGVPASRYRAATDLGSILRASDPAAKPRPIYRVVGAALDVWLDRQNRPLRVVEALEGASVHGEIAMRTVITFSAYGSATDIRAPANVQPTRSLRAGPPTPLVGGPTHIFERLVASGL
jgi:hypothetical protein